MGILFVVLVFDGCVSSSLKITKGNLTYVDAFLGKKKRVWKKEADWMAEGADATLDTTG